MNDTIRTELNGIMSNWDELYKQVQLNNKHSCQSINLLVSATMDILLDVSFVVAINYSNHQSYYLQFKLLTNTELLDAEYRNNLQEIFIYITTYSKDLVLQKEVAVLYEAFDKGWKSRFLVDLLNGKMGSQCLESRDYIRSKCL